MLVRIVTEGNISNFDTGKDCLTNALSRAEELGIGASDRETELKAYIQARYLAVVGEGFPWSWAKKTPPGILTTVAEITTGTVAVTNGSATITFSSAPAASVKDRKFYVEGDGTLYRISTHTAGNPSATLDGTYLGTTAAAAAYRMFQDEYDLDSTFLAPVGKPFIRDLSGTPGRLDFIGEDELVTQYPWLGSGSSRPRYVAIIGDKKVRVAPWPTEARRYEYDFIRHPGVLDFSGNAATDTPIIQPAEDRIVLVLGAVADVLIDKDDDRAPIHAQGFTGKLQAMKLRGIRGRRPRAWSRPGYLLSTPR